MCPGLRSIGEDMSELLDFAREIAVAAGNALKEGVDKPREILDHGVCNCSCK